MTNQGLNTSDRVTLATCGEYAYAGKLSIFIPGNPVEVGLFNIALYSLLD